MANFPTTLDATTDVAGRVDAAETLGSHSGRIGALIAAQNKIGIGNTAAVLGAVLLGTGAAASEWAALPKVTAGRTATSDGLTTGIIPAGGGLEFIAVTSAGATDIITLPAPVVGKIVILAVGANGYELRSSTPTSIAIGGGTGGAVESAIPAASVAVAICVSATAWLGFTITAATLAAIEAAA